MSNPVHEFYGNRLRLRVCGLCIENDQLLLVKHHLDESKELWIPPGGGVELGESATDALQREFEEETGLLIEVKEFLFACEYIVPPLHAVELFFTVTRTGGTLKTGTDPELKEAIIKEVRYVPWQELAIWPATCLHGIFQKVNDPLQIMALRGYFKL